MTRLRAFDWLLLAFVLVLWSACFCFYLREAVQGRLARVPVFVASPSEDGSYPTFAGFWPGSSARMAELTVGDQLLRVGDADLRGVGPVGFLARAYEQARGRLAVDLTFLHAGQPREMTLRFDPVLGLWGITFMIVGLAVTGVLVFVRMPRSRQARAYFLGSLVYSIHWSLFFGGAGWQTYAWIAVYTLSSALIFPLILYTVLVLPEEATPTNRWLFPWMWMFALRGLTAFSWYFGWPLPHEIGMRATNLLEFVFLIALLAVLTANFRRAGPIGRRQLKWVVYGLYIGVAPVLAGAAIALLNPRLWWLQEASIVTVTFVPVCICIAVLRFNLFDIDRLISSTAAYSLLLIMVGVGVVVAAPFVVTSLSTAMGLEQTVGQVAFSLFLAFVSAPSHRYLRPQIERFFFAQRYALEQGVKQLMNEVAVLDSHRSLLPLVGERLFTLFRPENCVVYEQRDGQYEPVFTRGSVTPISFAVLSPLVSALQARSTHSDVERWRRVERSALPQSEQTMLRNLRVAAVVPIRHEGTSLAFFCLGQKSSGDVYTSTDFALLTALSENLAASLQRCNAATKAGRTTGETSEAVPL